MQEISRVYIRLLALKSNKRERACLSNVGKN